MKKNNATMAYYKNVLIATTTQNNLDKINDKV